MLALAAPWLAAASLAAAQPVHHIASSGAELSCAPPASTGLDIERGVATWYGPDLQGRLTANGEKFNMHDFTAAHRTLPFGTRVLVRSLRNGRQVVVRINDRGPYLYNRVIDLSQAAASSLGMKARGRDTVVLCPVQPRGYESE
jgi:rare lipoprotein A